MTAVSQRPHLWERVGERGNKNRLAALSKNILLKALIKSTS
jgi:hypothetical protein